MRADRYGAVRIGASKSKGEAGRDIRFAPIGAVGRRSHPRTRMRAVRVRRPRPDLRLVEMDVCIDEAGPDLPAVQIDGVRCAAKGSKRGNAAARDAQIEADETFRIGWPECSS